jgi:WD40 repeat protein
MKKLVPFQFLILLVVSVQAQNLETIVQKGHELSVLAVAISPDSTLVATGSKDKSVKLWEYHTGREIRTLFGHDHSVTSIAFSPDGKYLISGSYDKSVRIWNVSNGKELHNKKGEDFITDVAIDPKMRFYVSAGYNRYGTPDSATVYDWKTRNKIARLPINADEGRGYGVSLSISPQGEWLGFGEDNRVVRIYDTQQWKLANTFEFTEGWCGGCATVLDFSPDSKYVYMVSEKGPLKKYQRDNNTLVKVYEEKIEDVAGLDVSNDGSRIARATEKDLKVFDAATGNILATLPAQPKAEFHRIQFTPDNKKLLVTSDNNTAFIWDFSSGKTERTFTGFLNQRDAGGLNYDPNFSWQAAIAKYVRFKNSILISKDGKSLIKGKFGTGVRQWDIATGKTIMNFAAHSKAVLAYDLSKDGNRLLTGGGDGKIILWDLLTGDTLKVIRSYTEPIFDISFNSDETKAVSTSWDATMKIHDLESGVRLTYLELPENSSAYSVTFHPNDLYILAARLNHAIELWEPDTRTVVRSFVGHTDVVSTVIFAPDGKNIISASWDGTIRIWDVASGLMVRKLNAHNGAVYTITLSPDKKHIYSGGADRQVKVWDISSGVFVKQYEGHQAEVTSIVFSPDNKMLLTHSVDGITKFWDLTSGREFFEHIHLAENEWMVKSPEGYFNGTDKARAFIHFVSENKTYSVDQFFNEFYRPDLLPKIFQSRGSSDEKQSIQGKLKSSPPPIVKIAALGTGEGKAEVYVRVIDNGGGVSNMKIFHNGKSISIDETNLKLPAGKGQMFTYKHPINLIGGTNTFTATARNNDNIESDVVTAEIVSEYATKSSICHLLVVGINQYKNPKLSLNYAKPDAESFRDLLGKKGSSLFKSIKMHELYDGNATRANILQKLDELAREVSSEDVFIFYYAGHGSMVDDKFYFIPTEGLRLYDAPSLNKESIEAGVLQEKFRHIRALKQLIVMDACQSGGSVELLASRGAGEEKAIAQLSRSAGIHVMASAGSEQFATEFSELGHGVFTYAFIRGIQGEADGAPKDGKVTIYELKSYIDDQVPELTRTLKGKPQYPYTFSRGQDFPLAIE